MARTSNFALRLQDSLMNAVREMAARDGASINQFINVAVAEKLSALATEELFRERAERAAPVAFYSALDSHGASAPSEGDEIPEGFEDTEFFKRLKGAKK